MNQTVPSALWIDVHIHKNGGTSIRDAMMRMRKPPKGHAKLLDKLYSYRSSYHIRGGLPQLLADMECKHRVALELHEHRWIFRFVWLPQINKLRLQYQNCTRIILSTRVREPFSAYTSMYAWADILKRFNATFDKWAAPNLQTAMWLSGDFRGFAEGRLWSGARHFNSVDYDGYLMASSIIKDFTFAYTTESSDTILPHLISCVLGQNPPAWFFNSTIRTPGLPPSATVFHAAPLRAGGGAHSVQKVHTRRMATLIAEICPNVTKCQLKVQSIAPYDYLLYEMVAKGNAGTMHIQQRFGKDSLRM